MNIYDRYLSIFQVSQVSIDKSWSVDFFLPFFFDLGARQNHFLHINLSWGGALDGTISRDAAAFHTVVESGHPLPSSMYLILFFVWGFKDKRIVKVGQLLCRQVTGALSCLLYVGFGKCFYLNFVCFLQISWFASWWHVRLWQASTELPMAQIVYVTWFTILTIPGVLPGIYLPRTLPSQTMLSDIIPM